MTTHENIAVEDYSECKDVKPKSECKDAKPKHRYSPELKLDFLQTEDVAVAKLALCSSDYDKVEVLGDAKRHPTDEVDLGVGEDLALARAFMRLAFQLVSRHDSDVLLP